MAKKLRPKGQKQVEALRHVDATRVNIPTAEHQGVVQDEHRRPVPVSYPRRPSGLQQETAERNRDLDPQLVWRGKDEQNWSDLVVQAPALYIQEKVHPKALIDDLLRQSRMSANAEAEQTSLFADFNGIPEGAERTDFYQHEGRWQNRMILGDSLQVMASLAEREGLRGKVQCIYIDPPYGIKFNSNFQWSTTSRDVKDGNAAHITREPEQVKAFRDTWRDGIHTYLTYLRDRLTVARDLLTESGSIFVQIGDENVHRVRALMDEVFGGDSFISAIPFAKTTGFAGTLLSSVTDTLLWYGRSIRSVKYRPLLREKEIGQTGATQYRTILRYPQLVREWNDDSRLVTSSDLTSQGESRHSEQNFFFRGTNYRPPPGLHWKTSVDGMARLYKASRIFLDGRRLRYARFLNDFPVYPLNNVWMDTGISGFSADRRYVVETLPFVIERCIQMTTDPGDLVLDPTCGSGTTAYVAEHWGRRWITIDTSRVALALARARIMGARYPYYLLTDSPEGRAKEAEITRTAPKSTPTFGNIRHGFVYQRVPHITLKSIANDTEIDVIWEQFQEELEPLRTKLNSILGKKWEEWEIPREPGTSWPDDAKQTHSAWWAKRIERQQEIDASIAAKADYELLYDKPYEDNKTVRVAGPFTVESLSPHRMITPDEAEDSVAPDSAHRPDPEHDFTAMILENLRAAGVQQAAKDDRIVFTSLAPWPGSYVSAEGRYDEGETEKRAAVFIGPEFGTVSRADLVAAAKEAGDGEFDVLIACAFAYDAHSADLDRLGRVPILKARMNADLHMAGELSGKGNLFVVFGEPDVEVTELESGQYQVEVKGVDVYDPNSGEVRSDGPDGIACWFIDTDYDESSFFVRHAYFLGANDPYRALKTTLKAEIDEEAWDTLNSAISRPFPKPRTGRIAVKVINHLGDEVMKVYRLP